MYTAHTSAHIQWSKAGNLLTISGRIHIHTYYGKKRINQKKDKRTILQGALLNYARYGKNNPFSDVLSEDRLNQITPDDLNIIVKNLSSYKHRILYFGKRNSKINSG